LSLSSLYRFQYCTSVLIALSASSSIIFSRWGFPGGTDEIITGCDSGSGSDSDSDGSSSDSDDENMDEDVEIVSDDEDGDTPHQKPKANDKKKVKLKELLIIPMISVRFKDYNGKLLNFVV